MVIRRKKIKHPLKAIVAIFVLLAGCTSTQSGLSPKNTALTYEVLEAPEWSAQFVRNDGWFGGDGIFFIPTLKNGKRNNRNQLVLFSDTMVGQIKAGKLQEGFYMVNNSVALLDKAKKGAETTFLLPSNEENKATSIFPVHHSNPDSEEYFWLGDGTVNSTTGSTYIFAYRVADRHEWEGSLFKFEVLGGAMIVLPSGSEHPFPDQYQLELPFFLGVNEGHTSFGAGVLEDDYTYIYGIRDPGKQLLVARVEAELIEQFDQWQFYDGSHWVSDFKESTAVTDSVSNELSVSKLSNGQYALIFQINGVSNKVGMRLGPSPIGPFGNIEEIWDCSGALKEKEFFAYNAKAHPSISDPGELLVSYNVNSFAFWDQIWDHPQLYRPRFIKIKFKED